MSHIDDRRPKTLSKTTPIDAEEDEVDGLRDNSVTANPYTSWNEAPNKALEFRLLSP
jgi:hypothetical protein